MADFRIKQHPILPIVPRKPVSFYWKGQVAGSYLGETVASALIANGIHVFGHHHKDGSPQGIFCANGQCAQCLVLMDGRPVKSCMEPVKPGCRVEPADGLPELPIVTAALQTHPIQEINVPVLIIGGGPAGLSAAIELGKLGIKSLLVDDKSRLGGKLVLQTHRFFGSISAVYAGTRGIDIATRLQEELSKHPAIEVWLRSTVLAVFSDKKVGILKEGEEYVLVKPQVLLVASGAREKALAFQGNTLPGVYGAGAFQTLVNRDLVKPCNSLFIVGGGNVGLITGYHALQAGINVAGLVEALPECGGYKVHKDKLTRMGVPIYTSHTVVSANGADRVESITIARVDNRFNPVPGSEKSFECDCILVAVGLDPVNEFYLKAKEFDLPVFAAGDAEEIAEASAAIYTGKIRGLEIGKFMGYKVGEIPTSWYHTSEILKSRPGRTMKEELPEIAIGVSPVIHCTQEIPCDPCASICPQGLIYIDRRDIRHVPTFLGNNFCCGVCERCVAICPGLAITLVDYRSNPDIPTVSIPYEFARGSITEGDMVTVMDTEGNSLGKLEVLDCVTIPSSDRTMIVRVAASAEISRQIAGIRVQDSRITHPMDHYVQNITNDTIVCRCERVSAGDIRELIRQGYRDMNEIKAVSKAGMGACGAKTCNALIHRLFKDEGIPLSEISEQTRRPLFIEVPLGIFAGTKEGDGTLNG